MINLILFLLFMGFLFRVGNNFLEIPDILLRHRIILRKLTPSKEFSGSEELTLVEPRSSLFANEKIKEESNNDLCLPNGTEVEIAKLKLDDIENSIYKLKAQSLENDRLNLTTLTTEVTKNKSQPLHLVLPLGGVAVEIRNLFSSINEGNVNCNEEELLYESKGKELKDIRKGYGIKPDNAELANGRLKSLQGKDQVFTESPSWHKCTHNSSIIHTCKKSTLSFQSDGYTTICPSFFNECKITKENQNQSLANEYYQTTSDEKTVVKSINNSHINNESFVGSKIKMNFCSTHNNSFISNYPSRMHYTSATGPSKPQRIDTCYDFEQSELCKSNRRFEVVDVENSNVINKKVLNTGLGINKYLVLTEHEIFETTNNSETDNSNRKVLQETNKQNLFNYELSEDLSLLSFDTKDDESKSNLQFCFFKNDQLLNASHTDKIETEDYSNSDDLDSMQIVHNVMKTMNSNYKTVTNSNNGGPSKLIGYIYHKSLRAYVGEEYKIFIEKEKINKDIVENQLGLDKESSILFILKTLEDKNNRLLQSSLSPRQKISLACSLFSAINDFNICGSTWALICSEVIKDINGNFVRLYLKEKNYRHCLRCLCVIYEFISVVINNNLKHFEE